MFLYVFLCFVALFSVNAGSVLSGEEENALQAIIIPLMKKCEDITKVKDEPGTRGSPKLIICALKETKIIDAKGMFDKDTAIILLKTAVKNEKFLEYANELGDICLKVNELDVTDGEKGEERAAYLMKCVEDNAHKIQK